MADDAGIARIEKARDQHDGCSHSDVNGLTVIFRCWTLIKKKKKIIREGGCVARKPTKGPSTIFKPKTAPRQPWPDTSDC
eukprot:2006200-Rhodomonas_salina.3